MLCAHEFYGFLFYVQYYQNENINWKFFIYLCFIIIAEGVKLLSAFRGGYLGEEPGFYGTSIEQNQPDTSSRTSWLDGRIFMDLLAVIPESFFFFWRGPIRYV